MWAQCEASHKWTTGTQQIIVLPIQIGGAQCKVTAMRASMEIHNNSVQVKFLGRYDQVVKVVIGGGDGPLITIDQNGHIHVLPSQGPGDPELRRAFVSLAEILQVIRTRVFPQPCELIAENIGDAEMTISRLAAEPQNPATKKQLADAQASLAALHMKYREEGCSM
jgi:hypothetical protein